MKLALHIAFRYLFAKKSYHAINVISAISVAGVMITTMSLVVVLSVFNGFDDLIKNLYNAFDPDLKITLAEGKNFIPGGSVMQQLYADPAVEAVSLTLQEQVLIRHQEHQDIPLLKGVDDRYEEVTGLERFIMDGSYLLQKDSIPYALMGQTTAINLQAGPSSLYPLEIFLLKKGTGIPLNPSEFFHRILIFPSGIFSVEEEANQFVLISLDVLRTLIGEDSIADAVEIRLRPGTDAILTQQRIASLFGSRFSVQNRYQQKELFYNIMQYEKWAGFMILAFILLIASFNVIGSLSMLILEKEKDMNTLRNMGANNQLIRRIFVCEGMLISTAGALGGILLGVLLCWLQQKYGFLKLQGSGNFIIDAYPVRLHGTDLWYTIIAVAATGWFTTWYPVHRFFKRF